MAKKIGRENILIVEFSGFVLEKISILIPRLICLLVPRLIKILELELVIIKKFIIKIFILSRFIKKQNHPHPIKEFFFYWMGMNKERLYRPISNLESWFFPKFELFMMHLSLNHGLYQSNFFF